MTDEQKIPQKRRKGLITGGVILLIGVVWLLNEVGVYLPGWLFGWEMILIVIGLAIGVDNKFTNPASYILILIGGVFLLDEIFYLPFNIFQFFWPVLVIVIGLLIILRPSRKRKNREWEESDSPYDKLDLVAVFNGTKRTVLSKNFVGGETVTVFGGTEINLLQADLQHEVVLDCTAVFGGLKLIVPRHWDVRVEATSIFGGVEDKRSSAVDVVPEEKILIITGTVLFGGIDVVSY